MAGLQQEVSLLFRHAQLKLQFRLCPQDIWVDLLDTGEAEEVKVEEQEDPAEVKVREHGEDGTDELVQEDDIVGNRDRSMGNEDLSVISCADEMLTPTSEADVGGADISCSDFEVLLVDADVSNADVEEATTAASVTKCADIDDTATDDADRNETVFVSCFNKVAVIKDVDLDGAVNLSSVVRNADTDDTATASSVTKAIDVDETVTMSSVNNDAETNDVDIKNADIDEAVNRSCVTKATDTNDADTKDADLNEAVTMSYITKATDTDDADIKDGDLDDNATMSSVTIEANTDDANIRHAVLDGAVTVSSVRSDAAAVEIMDITARDGGIWTMVNPLTLAVDSSELDTLPQVSFGSLTSRVTRASSG